MSAKIPHRFLPEGWPNGHQWEVRLTVNNQGYVTYCVVQHIRTRDPNGRKIKPWSGTVHGPVLHGDQVLDLVRSLMIDAAVISAEQMELTFG